MFCAKDLETYPALIGHTKAGEVPAIGCDQERDGNAGGNPLQCAAWEYDSSFPGH